MKQSLLFAAMAAAIPLGVSTAQAAIVGALTYSGPATVNVGDTITARISLSTDNLNGIAGVSPRIQTSLVGINGTPDTAPFEAAVIPSSGAAGNSTALTVFNPALAPLGNTVVTAKQAATFVVDGTTSFLEPSTTNTNRPITGFTGQGTDGRGTPQFVSAGNAVQTYFADVSFRATQAASNVYFGLLFSTDGSEYSSANLATTDATTVTPTVAASATGFSVKINAVPEPATGLLLFSGLAVISRRRRA